MRESWEPAIQEPAATAHRSFLLVWDERIYSMSVTLELSPETEAALNARAQAQGLSLQQWLTQMVVQLAPPKPSAYHLQTTNPKEWARQFREWADCHDPNTPVLSDEAMSRDSIYPDHI
jgi:hypothetical protein